jgi:hypothetical protein
VGTAARARSPAPRPPRPLVDPRHHPPARASAPSPTHTHPPPPLPHPQHVETTKAAPRVVEERPHCPSFGVWDAALRAVVVKEDGGGGAPPSAGAPGAPGTAAAAAELSPLELWRAQQGSLAVQRGRVRRSRRSSCGGGGGASSAGARGQRSALSALVAHAAGPKRRLAITVPTASSASAPSSSTPKGGCGRRAVQCRHPRGGGGTRQAQGLSATRIGTTLQPPAPTPARAADGALALLRFHSEPAPAGTAGPWPAVARLALGGRAKASSPLSRTASGEEGDGGGEGAEAEAPLLTVRGLSTSRSRRETTASRPATAQTRGGGSDGGSDGDDGGDGGEGPASWTLPRLALAEGGATSHVRATSGAGGVRRDEGKATGYVLPAVRAARAPASAAPALAAAKAVKQVHYAAEGGSSNAVAPGRRSCSFTAGTAGGGAGAVMSWMAGAAAVAAGPKGRQLASAAPPALRAGPAARAGALLGQTLVGGAQPAAGRSVSPARRGISAPPCGPRVPPPAAGARHGGRGCGGPARRGAGGGRGGEGLEQTPWLRAYYREARHMPLQGPSL